MVHDRMVARQGYRCPKSFVFAYTYFLLLLSMAKFAYPTNSQE